MLKATAGNFNAARVTDAALAASRQVWLAGLGAARVTRQWTANDAGQVFRSLVREGEVMEGRALRVIGKRFDDSLALATVAWNRARYGAVATVSGLVDAAAATLPRLRTNATAKPAAKKTRRSPAKTRRTRKAKRSLRKA